MDSELVAIIAGFIISFILALWYLSDRLSDKIKEVESGLSGKFDTLIEKISNLEKEIFYIKESTTPSKTVETLLQKSLIHVTISPRLYETTTEYASFTIKLSEKIRESLTWMVVNKLNEPQFEMRTLGSDLFIIRLKTKDINENAKIIKSFLDLLDEQVSKENKALEQWRDSIEKKLAEIL